MARVTVELPEELAEEARSRGLLTSDAIGAMIREKLARSAGEELLDATERLASARFPPMTLAEIQAEVEAVRVQRAARQPATSQGEVVEPCPAEVQEAVDKYTSTGERLR